MDYGPLHGHYRKSAQCLISVKRFLTSAKHFHNLFHSSISAGDALRVLKRENFAVKTFASPVDGKESEQATDEENTEIKAISHSWLFNLKQLMDPAGFWVKRKRA